MGYVDRNLMRDEQVIHEAKMYWFIFVPGVVFLIAGAYLFFAASLGGNAGPALGMISTMVAIISLMKALIAKLSTELAVTSKRVIAKVGFIGRTTAELNHSKVESFNVEQSIFGRIFGFGTVIVNGTGANKTTIPNIDSPLEFRRSAMQSIDDSQS